MSCSSIRIHFNRSGTLWSYHRDTSLSWLALGVLLAAWNACDDDPLSHVMPRPEILREYPVVSRRALGSTQARQVVETLAPPAQ